MPATLTTREPAPPADSARDADEANPFAGPENLALSDYYARVGGKLTSLSDPDADRPDHGARRLSAAAADGAFRAVIGDAGYPCVGAKSAFNNDSYRLGVYDDLAGDDATAGLCRDLFIFSREFEAIDARFATFAATFRGPLDVDEVEFERLLWTQLQKLHVADAPLHDWDGRVSSDPDDPHFSFSFAGRAFFIVGLHPRASRVARRFPYPTLIFNAHEQFELLRSEGKMERMKQVIRRKDEELQGGPNPLLRDFGDESEARQYSGRAVEDDWSPPFSAVGAEPKGDVSKCPFHRLLGLVGGGKKADPHGRSGSR